MLGISGYAECRSRVINADDETREGGSCYRARRDPSVESEESSRESIRIGLTIGSRRDNFELDESALARVGR